MFFKMDVKKCFHDKMQKEKKCLKTQFFLEKMSANPKNGNPPPDKKIMVRP